MGRGSGGTDCHRRRGAAAVYLPTAGPALAMPGIPLRLWFHSATGSPHACTELLTTETDGAVLWITLCRGDKRNPMSSDLIAALTAALNQAYGDDASAALYSRPRARYSAPVMT